VRVAVIGQGSIGRRHAAYALALGHEAIVYDPFPQAQPPPGAQPAIGVEECLEGAEAAVIASPSSEHAAQARTAIELGVPVLVEKPLALDQLRAAELDWLARARGVLLSVAMNLRELPGVQALRSLLGESAVGRVLHARAWCGSWLPGWHPLEDYRTGYSARRELGGGVLLDVAVHELDYLLWLLGPARAVSAIARRVSDLEIDVEDVALVALELESGAIAEVSVDYLDHCYARGCRIVGAERTLRWNWEHARVGLYRVDGEEVFRVASPNDIEGTYRTQLVRFLAAAGHGGEAPVPAAQAQRVLAVIDAARRSSQEGRRVTLAPALELRLARPSDEQRLLAWRNDPETRRSSRQQQEIERDEHRRWLQRTLKDPSVRLWVVETEGGPVGQVRVCRDAGGMGELHVALAPEARRRGLGAGALVQASGRALAELGLTGLRAHVKPGNEASMRVFARAGFEQAGTREDGLLLLQRAAVTAAAPAPAR
jgi:predicted dehydrogenase/RimJ/RimL family protein N-acetyltransferase